MARGVLHVIDPTPTGVADGRVGLLGRGAAADIAILACAEAIRSTPEDAHAVVVLGGGDAVHHARALGLPVHAHAPAPFGHAGLGARALRRVARALGGTDLLQPWSERARTACRLAGAGEGAVAPVPSALWPGPRRPVGPDRHSVRAQLGVPDHIPMVALLADPCRHADARRFVYMVGLLDVAGIPVAGLIDRRAAHVSRARRFHADAGVRWRMLLPAEPTARLLHACDLAVIVPPTVRAELTAHEHAWVAWSVLRAHLLGVPVVGADAWLPESARPTDAAGLLHARSESVTDIGRQLARLAADAVLRRAVADGARAAASAFVERQPLADSLRALWSTVEPFETGAALALGPR
ncbi:MAG: hypothetical protein IT431_05645 [Phycisphaerales bacterium]|nr:hypothetical protein [Phycisphaerales bacterium]